MKIAVLASGEGTNLQALLDTVHERDGIEIVAVASDKRDAPALARAQAVGVPSASFPMSNYVDRERRDRAICEWLVAQRVELVVLAGYMQLLSRDFLERFPGSVINLHPALLPAFPGLHAVDQALAYGVKVFGATVHFVDAGVDTGPVILQRAVDLPETCEAEDVLVRLQPVERALLSDAVRLIARGAVRLDPTNSRRVLITH